MAENDFINMHYQLTENLPWQSSNYFLFVMQFSNFLSHAALRFTVTVLHPSYALQSFAFFFRLWTWKLLFSAEIMYKNAFTSNQNPKKKEAKTQAKDQIIIVRLRTTPLIFNLLRVHWLQSLFCQNVIGPSKIFFSYTWYNCNEQNALPWKDNNIFVTNISKQS